MEQVVLQQEDEQASYSIEQDVQCVEENVVSVKTDKTDAPSISTAQIITASTSEDAQEGQMVEIYHDYEAPNNSVLIIQPPDNQVSVQAGETQQGNNVTYDSEAPLCLVCADKGSGFHYSAYTCEGCKGFFKRTVQKNLTYCCKDSSQCVINKITRNSCQYCRFKKCLEVGMQREAVREDRSPGGKHRHKRARLDEGSMPAETVNTGGDAEWGAILPKSLTVSETDLITQLLEAHPDLIPEGPSNVDDDSSLDINTLMQYGYMELRLIIEWARKVPGFSSLVIEDQMALLKASFMELNVFRLGYRSLPFDRKVKFADGIIMSEALSSDIGWGKDLINCTLEFIAHMKDIEIDSTEFAIVNAIILTYPDATGVQDKVQIMQLQSSFIDCLWKYTSTKYPTDSRRYGKMLLRLPSLRTVSAKAAERFLSMSLDGSIKMNALVLEMMS